jgi:predicted SAM-dependent methyltransferase
VLTVNVHDNCDIKVTDHNLPIDNESIGYIISSHTLEHIPNTELVLKEWCRVLRSNGLIAITMPDKRYFKHENREGINPYDFAYCEMEPSELKYEISKIKELEILIFDANKNNFDINALLRKKGKI